MSADYLAGLDPTRSAERWRESATQPSPGVLTLVARDDEGILGFASSGPARDDDPPTGYELYVINLLARAHGTGLADALLARALGDRAAYLWVAEGNHRAIGFYRRHGFSDDGGRSAHPPTDTTEIRMWRSAGGAGA